MIWESALIRNIVETKIFNICIKIVLLYGNGTKPVNKGHNREAQTFVNNCLKRI